MVKSHIKDKKIVIIGAGIGGLAAGALLVKKGYDVTVFEQEKKIGGRALSFNGSEMCLDEYRSILPRFNMGIAFSEPSIEEIFSKDLLNGYTLDLGYHAIGGGGYIINRVFSEFDKHVDFLESKVGFIDEKSYCYPFLSKLDKLKILPNILRLVLSSKKTLKKLDSVSMSDTIKRYGKGKMKLILEVFSRSITTINDLDKISTGETFRAQRNLYRGSKPVGYPVEGLDSVSKKLADIISRNGGSVKLEAKVDEIIIENDNAVGVKFNGSDLFFDAVVSNILVQNLFDIVDEKRFPSNYVDYLKNLEGTGSLCAYYSLKNIPDDLKGKCFHFIKRGIGVKGNDAVGMIDFMTASDDANLTPPGCHLIQSYIICSPDEAKNKEFLKKLKNVLDKKLNVLIPGFKNELNWAIYPNIWHLDGVAKTIDKDKPSIKTPVENLYLVGDCVKAPGIGFNCAVNSACLLSRMLDKKRK